MKYKKDDLVKIIGTSKTISEVLKKLNLNPKGGGKYLRTIVREILIFSIIWMATRDIYIAITMTAAFIVLADYLFNENSSYCVLPEKYKQIHKLVDTNEDGLISPEEIKKAEETLRKAKKQDHKINQLNMMSYFQTNLNQTI